MGPCVQVRSLGERFGADDWLENCLREQENGGQEKRDPGRDSRQGSSKLAFCPIRARTDRVRGPLLSRP
jgi:hypothetical protein